jgi:tetratricopeptide (TPR) repeat protein
MNCAGLRALVLLSAVSLGPPVFSGAPPAKDQVIFNQAKTLMFEQKLVEAGQVFQRLIREFPQSSVLPQAYFYTAYCLRLQKKPAEALLAYEQFLQKYPGEPTFAAQARQVVVELAASLVEQGQPAYRNRLITALGDPRKEVRYFAAIRCSSLKDRQLNSLSVPVLKEIMAKEKQQDLVKPASFALLRIDPAALSRPEPQKTAKSQSKPGDNAVKMFHFRVYEGGENTAPKVEFDIPVSFVQLFVKALDESTKAELRKRGVDLDNVWESLNQMGPAKILTIRDGASVIKLWIQ